MTTAEKIAAAIAAMRAILDHEEIGDIACRSADSREAIFALACALDELLTIPAAEVDATAGKC